MPPTHTHGPESWDDLDQNRGRCYPRSCCIVVLVLFAVVDGGDDDDDDDGVVVVVGLFAACLFVSLLLLARAAPYTATPHRNHKLCKHTVVSCTPHMRFGKKCDHIA